MDIHWDELGEIREAEREKIEARLRRLVEEHDDVLSIRIAGQASQHHRHGGREVHITAMAKGQRIAASRAAPDLGKALHDAVQVFAHELRRSRERRSARPAERAGGPALLGLVDRVDVAGGYGFAVTDDGTSVYFHRNAVSGGLDFNTLEVGQRIALNVEAGTDGPQATVIAPAGPDVPSP
jgi:cold shock CspA family protein/ribosome-associated translation inhibitor RaiA